MKVICISGHAQNGKDSTAEFLRVALETLGHSVLITHYGDLVKYICKAFFDWDGKKDELGRSLLQHVGTDIVRKRDPDYWVRFIGEMMMFFGSEWDYVLIPDCRFPNEIEHLRSIGLDCVHLRVHRPNFESPLTPEQQAHPSETALDSTKPDIYVHNDGSLGDLAIKVAKLVPEIAEYRCTDD